MQTHKPIALNGQPIAGGKFPLICTPLVGRTPDQLMAELAVVLPKQPDVLEWRVDFFEQIGDAAAVIAAASAIKKAAGNIPLLFTRRSIIEGGEKIALTEDQVLALYEAVCASKNIDLIDYELANDTAHIARVRTAAKTKGIGLVLSFHNFSYTPGPETLAAKFLNADQLGADVAKVAVMPRDLDDVLTLLAATRAASQKLRIPLISMAMGPLGAVSRLVGGVFPGFDSPDPPPTATPNEINTKSSFSPDCVMARNMVFTSYVCDKVVACSSKSPAAAPIATSSSSRRTAMASPVAPSSARSPRWGALTRSTPA